jgi:drug/metabolite transporter (DMT)-like permease
MALASLLFATMNVCVRLSARHVPWPEVAAVRALLGAAVAIAVARTRRAPLVIVDHKAAWARSAFGTVGMLCGFYTLGAPSITLGDAMTLGATSPIFIALLSPWLLREHADASIWIPTFVAFIGVALIAGPNLHLSGPLALVALLGALFSAMAMIWLRRLSAGNSGAAPESPEAIVVHFSLVAGAVMTMLALPVLKMPDAQGALLLAVTGTAGALAQITMTRAYSLDRAARVGAAGNLTLVLSYVGGVFALGEPTTLLGILGTLCVIAAGLALTLLAMRESGSSSLGIRNTPRST